MTLTPIGPLACGGQVCSLAVQPTVVLVGVPGQPIQVVVQVPTDRSLIRRNIGVQAGCFDTLQACVELTMGVMLRFYA